MKCSSHRFRLHESFDCKSLLLEAVEIKVENVFFKKKFLFSVPVIDDDDADGGGDLGGDVAVCVDEGGNIGPVKRIRDVFKLKIGAVGALKNEHPMREKVYFCILGNRAVLLRR